MTREQLIDLAIDYLERALLAGIMLGDQLVCANAITNAMMLLSSNKDTLTAYTNRRN